MIKKYKNKIKIYKEITTKGKYPKKTNEIKQRTEPRETKEIKERKPPRKTKEIRKQGAAKERRKKTEHGKPRR